MTQLQDTSATTTTTGTAGTSDPGADSLLDHDYDGIREYDNPLPGWWVWLFALTFLFAFPYIAWFHIGVGPSIHDDYEGELAAFAEQLMATYGDLSPDEPTILKFMDDEVAMVGMASLFKSKCAQCHRTDGSGDVGPNLTDEYWINATSLTGLARTITNGVVAKGMPAWGEQMSQTQIVLITAYVAQLRRNPVPGEAPEGNLIDPWPDPPAAPEAAPEAVPEAGSVP